MEEPQQDNLFQIAHATLLLSSFQRWLGYPLLPEPDGSLLGTNVAQCLFEAPFVVVSHGTQKDPIFNYGNRIALELFERTWSDFTSLPSRLSAEPINRAERARLLQTVAAQNYIDDYSGVRISSSGQRFQIPKAIVWNVVDEAGIYRGQAATFSNWEVLA